MNKFVKIFNYVKCPVIGMIHVKPLPGTPKFSCNIEDIVKFAGEEAILYKECGMDGLLVENMFDIPYVRPKNTGPEVTAIMTRVCTEIKKLVPSIPCGIQILAGNNFSALAVALASGLQFIRAEGFIFAHVADEGFMEADAGPLLRYRKTISADDILIFTDIKKKHSSHSITSDVSLCETAKAVEFFLSDGIIVTGAATGVAPIAADVKSVKESTSLPVLIGSGVTVENVDHFINAHGLIIGSHFKHDGKWNENLKKEKILNFMDKMNKLRF